MGFISLQELRKNKSSNNMVDNTTKYTPINGSKPLFFNDLKTHFSFLKTKRTVNCAYGFMFVFIAVTIFLAFSPSNNSSSPWFTNIFSLSSSSRSSSNNSGNIPIYSYFFSNNSNQVSNFITPRSKNSTFKPHKLNNELGSGKNESLNNESHDKVEILKDPLKKDSSNVKNQTQSSVFDDKNGVLRENETQSKDFDGKNGVLKGNETQSKDFDGKNGVLKTNQSQSAVFDGKNGVLKANQSNFDDKNGGLKRNQSNFEDKSATLKANQSKISSEKAIGTVNQTAKSVPKPVSGSNLTSSLVKKQSNGTNLGVLTKKGHEDLVKSLLKCDFFDGNWVKDESYPLYKPGSCSLIDEQFNCFLNGRPDNSYIKMKWKPNGCTLPRLNGTHMLELLRGKRLVFVGDSLNRNMWESLVCILRNSVKDQKKVYEEFGRHHFRTEASYSFLFEEYNCRVEFFVSPFLVQEWEFADKKGVKKETLRLDLIGQSADKYKNADILVFNTGHWWTHEKTSLGKDYYQEGSHVYSELDVLEAFRKALTTWGRWVDSNVNPKKTFVLFRGYSASHFSGGQWNSGGACDHETEPIKNQTYLAPYPSKMMVLERVFRGMKTQVSYLNVTRMTDYRKDGHPSIYRKLKLTDEERKSPLMFQDCSHWCLPGVPDAWNELLYAKLLVNNHKQQKNDKS